MACTTTIELFHKERGDILGLENLPDTSPHGAGFPQLIVNCLDVLIILCKQAPQVFEDLHLFQIIPMNGELLPDGQR